MITTERSILLLRIPENNEKKENVMASFLEQLAEILKGEKETISLEIAIYAKYIWFFLTCPASLKEVIKGQWYSHYSQSEVEEIRDPLEKMLFSYESPHFIGCELKDEQSEFIPFKTYKELEKNPLVAFSGLVNLFNSQDVAIIQLVLQPPEKENWWQKSLKHRRQSIRANRASKHASAPEYLRLEMEKETKAYYKCTFRVLVACQDSAKAKVNLAAATAVYTKNLERPSIQKLKIHRTTSESSYLEKVKQRKLGDSFRLTTEEIATIFHLPYNQEEISQIVQIRSKRAPAPQNLPAGQSPLGGAAGGTISLFGETNYQNQKIKFGIKETDRRRHLYVIGKTGMGKSKFLELLINGDIKANHGVILLDPHGDLSREVMNMIPENRLNDVIYFDPADTEYPIGFNPMEGVGSFEFRQNIVAGFISIFKKMFGLNWNERFEHVLRYTTLALLEYPQASVLGIPRMLTDNLFRQEVIKYVTDPLVKKFWATEFSSWNDQFASEAIVPIINKIGQFVANPMIRNMVGQAKSGFSLDEVMNTGKILIANFSLGKIGEESAALLGSMLITKIWQSALGRASIPEDERKDTFLFVDEFQNFATTAFANILSEARKYRLNLTVAHQYMQQLPSEVRATIFGNVGNIVSFRVGGEDAQILVKEFEPVFNVNDFLNLDMRGFFIKMSIDGQTTKPFSAQTLTVGKPEKNQYEKIIELSRNKYSKPRKEVEKELEIWEKGNIKVTIKHEEKKEDFYPEPII